MKTSFIPPRRALCGRRSTGQALVEFAIVAPVFFLLLFAIIEAGRFILYYETLNNATREGARYATVHGSASGAVATASDIQSVVRQWSIGLDPNSVVVTTTWTPGNNPGNQVKVRAEYTVAPFTGLILASGIPLGSNSVMVISQ